MKKRLFLIAFTFIFTGIKAQTNNDRTLLLQGFDEAKARKELTLKGLNADEHIDRVRRSYMINRAKELGLIKTSVSSYSDANNTNTARNGNQHNTTLSSTCPNSSFQLLNFSGWTGNTGSVNTASTWTLPATYVSGIVFDTITPLNSPLIEGGGPGSVLYGPSFNQIPTTNRHNIMNTPPTNNNPSSPSFSGYDSLAINPVTHLADIPFVSPNGSGTSLRLGNANGGGETENITYSIAVTSATSLFTFQYAVVLNNPAGGHNPDTQPFFSITTSDQYGYPIDSTTSCGTYTVNTDSAAVDTNYVHNSGDSYNAFADVFYKKWTSVSMDLTPYMGQTVNITFQTFDCAYSAHFGYAYIDAFCSPLELKMPSYMCAGTAVLQAPLSTSASYHWSGPGIVGNNNKSTVMINTSGVYNVAMLSPAGCIFNLDTTITFFNNTQSVQVISNTNILCADSVATLTASGAISYVWSTGDTSATISVTPTVSTTYTVTGLETGGCSDTAVVTQTVVSCNATGIDKSLQINEHILVYPNPANNNITIESNSELGSIIIYNYLGDIVFQITSKNKKEQIDISTLSFGIYTIQTKGSFIKLIKQ